MKKQTKRRLAIAIPILLLCVVGTWYLPLRRGAYQPHPIRPENFPEILIPPPHAELIDHSTPLNSRRREHTYGLNFVVDDPYPSNDTYRFVEKHLGSNGWQRLRYDLLNPKSPTRAPLSIPPYLGSEALDSIPSYKKKYRECPIKWRQENWVSEKDDHILVALSYSVDLSTGRVRRDRVYVLMALFQRHRPYIVHYKKLHPDEFDDATLPEGQATHNPH
ncbi:MAG: hypothetical protein KAY65_07790 [Planctomycetes bacterium]|nr:hypothetical protein [Planctomycetota bacterium]